MPVELTQQLKQINALEAVTGSLKPVVTADNALLHELQLGEQLNHSVVETRRADFSLMLAMLASDVREQSQFLVPQPEAAANVEYTNNSMRKELNLPNKAPLALSSLDDIKQFNQAQTIANKDFASIQLENAMQPKPLAFRDDKKYINTEVMGNTSLFTQLKHKQMQVKQALGLQNKQVSVSASDIEGIRNVEDKPLSQPFAFNAKAWLDGVQESIVKAPLLS